MAALESHKIDAHIATGRQKHGAPAPEVRPAQPESRVAAMAAKLRAAGYEGCLRLRKQVVEPVFGQIKQARCFRQFLRRGLAAVQGEWSLICTVHNLLKLAAARRPLQPRWFQQRRGCRKCWKLPLSRSARQPAFVPDRDRRPAKTR